VAGARKSARLTFKTVADPTCVIESESAHEQALQYADADSSTTADLCIFCLCSCPPVKPNGFQEEYDEPILAVKVAAINAMVIHGFVITQDTDTYVEGYRPSSYRKGSLCGRGGERAAIWLEQAGPSHTRVAVNGEKRAICHEELTWPILLAIRKHVIPLSNRHTW
jgi:hypothetical protein